MLARIIPSMFHRRVLLLGVVVFAGMVPPALQLWRLTVVRGDEYLAEAQKRLVAERWMPTHRGQILDRKGRVLAVDRPSFDIAIDYRVITGQWAHTQATRVARAEHRFEWATLSTEQRLALVERYLPPYQARLETMWNDFCRIAGITREELEARKAEVKAQVQHTAATVLRGQLAARQEELSRGRDVSVEVEPGRIVRPIREQVTPHVILNGVDDRTAFAFRRFVADGSGERAHPLAGDVMPGLSVVDSASRAYPYDTVEVAVDRSAFPGPLRADGAVSVTVRGVAAHVLGTMRPRATKEDMDRRPLERADGSLDLGHYQIGDPVGSTGIERSAEDVLRGLRGRSKEHLDTGEVEVIEPQAGRDVHLSLDVMLQARIQALFDPALGLASVQPWHKNTLLPVGTPLNGAAVVIDIDSAEVLALVSTPTFSREPVEGEDAPQRRIQAAIDMPHLNRAVSRPYTPGSIVKPLIYCAAVTEGVYRFGERIACHGHFLPGRTDAFRCWIYKQFNTTHTAQLGHDLDGDEALMVSCNIFFYELGRRLGVSDLQKWFGRFGVGALAERWELGLDPPGPGPEGADQRGTVEYGGTVGGAGHADATFMAIGQGPVDWTPLHAADAYATLGRSGVRITPRLRLDAPMEVEDLRLDQRAVRMALTGLRRAAEENLGTTHHITIERPDGTSRRENIFNAPGVAVWAKSGTADAPPLRVSLREGAPPETVRQGDHAWVVFLVAPAGETRPRFAVAVVVDYAGSGGRVSGPIANQVIHALIAEGYLER